MNNPRCLFSSDGLGPFVFGMLAAIVLCMAGIVTIVFVEVRRGRSNSKI
jgi:hypothetical protein